MLMEIGSLENVDGYIEDCLAQKQKIMGIGHRVYKTLDPRAPKLKRMAQVLSAKIGGAQMDSNERADRRLDAQEKKSQRER